MSAFLRGTFNLYSGEDRTLALTAKDRAGADVDISAATITCYLVNKMTGRRVKEYTGTVGASPAYTVTIGSTDTNKLTGEYLLQCFAVIGGLTRFIGRYGVQISSSGDPISEDYGES